MVREKIPPGQGKVREFYFESGKFDILKKSQGKLKWFNMADLIPLKAGRNILGHCDLNNNYFSLMKKGTLLKTYQSLVNGQVERMPISSH